MKYNFYKTMLYVIIVLVLMNVYYLIQVEKRINTTLRLHQEKLSVVSLEWEEFKEY